MKCAGCEQEVGGRYFTWGKRALPFCAECAKERFCLACELPAFYVKEKGSHTECARCSNALPECAYCGVVHGLEWWQFGSHKLCGKCGKNAKNFGLCLGCGNLDNRDKHNWCKECDSLPVFARDIERVDVLLEQVMEFLEADFGISVQSYCKLTLVSARQFKKRGFNSTGLFTRVGDKLNIYIEEGLPEAIFLSTLAHEAVHAWQQEECPSQTERLSEGLATWVEYRVLQACEVVDPAEWFVEALPSKYAEAFLLAQRCQTNLTEREFLRKAKSWTRFPNF